MNCPRHRRPLLALAVLFGASAPWFGASAASAPTPPGRSGPASGTAAPAAAAPSPQPAPKSPDLIFQPPPEPVPHVLTLAEVDRPPAALSQSAPVYPADAKAKRISAEVPVEFILSAEGVPTRVRAIAGAGRDFDLAAEEAVTKWRFRPAVKDGRAVPVQMKVTIQFRMN